MRRTKHEGGFEVLGKGDFGCVIATGIERFCDAERLQNVKLAPNATMVTKIIKSVESFDNERLNAIALSQIDPEQKYLLYPVAFCQMVINDDFEGACEVEKGRVMYLTSMQHGGVSLMAFEKQGHTFTEDETKKVYQDVLGGLALLHSHGRAHGDLQSGNVLVKRMPHGEVQAYLIDFGRATRPTTDDLNDFSGLILPTLKSLTERGEYRNTLQRMITENRKRTFATVNALAVDLSPVRSTPKRGSVNPKRLMFDD